VRLEVGGTIIVKGWRIAALEVGGVINVGGWRLKTQMHRAGRARILVARI